MTFVTCLRQQNALSQLWGGGGEYPNWSQFRHPHTEQTRQIVLTWSQNLKVCLDYQTTIKFWPMFHSTQCSISHFSCMHILSQFLPNLRQVLLTWNQRLARSQFIAASKCLCACTWMFAMETKKAEGTEGLASLADWSGEWKLGDLGKAVAEAVEGSMTSPASSYWWRWMEPRATAICPPQPAEVGQSWTECHYHGSGRTGMEHTRPHISKPELVQP